MTDFKRFTLYPEVDSPAPEAATWERLHELARVDVTVRTFMILAERGELTREQALVCLVFGFYEMTRRHYENAVDLLNTRPVSYVVLKNNGGSL
jgi:hypothetical protein